MQTTKTVKPETKLQALWRRLNKQTPFWKQRSDDRVSSDPERGGSLLGDIFNILMIPVIGALLMAFLIQFVIGPVFLSPGFLTDGLADPIGRGLAAVCAATGQCNVQYLLAGTVMAVLILFTIGYTALSPVSSEVVDDNDTIDAVLDATAALDERIVHLRADFVLAGVLPLSDEEKAEMPAAAPVAYQRPEVSDGERQAANHLALDLTANKSTTDIRKALAALAVENGRLLREVNDHREARGLEPLPAVRN